MLTILITIAFFVGFGLAWVFISLQKKQNQSILENQIKELKIDHNNLILEVKQNHEQITNLSNQVVSYESEVNHHIMRIQEQKQELNTIKQQLSTEFENLANRIFDEKGAKFELQNQVNLGNLLNPFGDRIKDFEKKVNEVYVQENNERISLRVQIAELSKLNQQMSRETQNLTKALKGDSKMQGDWGEMILESILDKSGLVNGREYIVQTSYSDEHGQRFRPDVIINLPESKNIIIDSKVSLTAYERLVSSTDDEDHNINLMSHIQSIKSHIKGLKDKNYQKLYKINSLDFVLMFIPIEGAFSIAIGYDNNIFDEAIKQNIIIVCPTTLIATMRTVYSVWRTEKSLQNSQEIAKIGGELYDRLVGFLTELDKIDDAIATTKKTYDSALTKLQGNKGVIKPALKLKELGVKSTKTIDNLWIEDV